MRKILTLTLLLLSITYAQAQDWINNESTLLYEQTMQTNENTQCIEEYDTNYLLTTTNKLGTNHYAFRLWRNGSAIFEGFLADTNCVISDVAIINDSAYFCGYRTVNGTNIGYIGRFNIPQFLNNQNCAYRVMNIPQATKIKKLVAYKTNNKDHIVAIGANTSNHPIVVELFPDSICNIFYNNSLQAERLSDIAVGEKYVVIAGEDTGSAKITLTRFFSNSLTYNIPAYHEHYKYDYTAMVDIAPFMLNADQVKITYLDTCMMALTTSAMDYSNNAFYTLVSVFNEHHLNILNTQVIPHNDKMIYLKDTEYDSVANRLYILEDNNLDNTGNYTSYILPVRPYAQTSYTLNAIKPEKNYMLNDIIAFDFDNKVIGVGINSHSFQALFSKNTNVTTQHCNKVRILKPVMLGQVPNVSSFIYQHQPYTISWQQNNFIGNNVPQIIECQSNQ